MLTIKELREYIKDLPDDMGVVTLDDDIYFSGMYSVGIVFGIRTNDGSYRGTMNENDSKFLYIM